MESFIAPAANHPMAKSILTDIYGEDLNTFYIQEEQHLLSILLLYLENTLDISFNSESQKSHAIMEVYKNLDKINTFEELKAFPYQQQITNPNILNLWIHDAFFFIATHAEFNDTDLFRKNMCILNLKKHVNQLYEKNSHFISKKGF